MKPGKIVVHMDNYNFTKFDQDQMKKKKVLLIAHFSVQNFKVSVELWKSYIVCDVIYIQYRQFTLTRIPQEGTTAVLLTLFILSVLGIYQVDFLTAVSGRIFQLVAKRALNDRPLLQRFAS